MQEDSYLDLSLSLCVCVCVCVCVRPQVGLDLVCDPIATPRKTKILCTLGPASWSEEGLAGLLDAGMNVARFNFSHGTHKAHQEVRGGMCMAACECCDFCSAGSWLDAWTGCRYSVDSVVRVVF